MYTSYGLFILNKHTTSICVSIVITSIKLIKLNLRSDTLALKVKMMCHIVLALIVRCVTGSVTYTVAKNAHTFIRHASKYYLSPYPVTLFCHFHSWPGPQLYAIAENTRCKSYRYPPTKTSSRRCRSITITNCLHIYCSTFDFVYAHGQR